MDEIKKDPVEVVTCPFCQGDKTVSYRLGKTLLWSERHRAKIVTCPLCKGWGFWLYGDMIRRTITDENAD